MKRDWVQVILIAVFLTASFRLIPLPIGDTARNGLTAALILASCGSKSIRFAAAVWPLPAIMLLSLILDVILGRHIGELQWIIWAQFVAALFVASAVFTLKFRNLKRVIWVSIGALFAHYAMIIFTKNYFVSMARSIGIVDPFVTYGRELDRIYFAYFQANSAAYTIFYMMLAMLAIDRVDPYDRRVKMAGLAILALLIVLTGGRGAMLLVVGLWLCLALSARFARFAIVIATLTIGWIVLLPLYSSIMDVIFLREQSNAERLTALFQYIGIIKEAPFFGHGIEAVRLRVETYGFKASHNFFVEVIAIFGLILGGALLTYFFVALVVRPKDFQLKVVGLFSLLPGIFNNTLLTNWGFIPLALPVIVLCSRTLKKRGPAAVPRSPDGVSGFPKPGFPNGPVPIRQ